jgi:hypothetical protein
MVTSNDNALDLPLALLILQVRECAPLTLSPPSTATTAIRSAQYMSNVPFFVVCAAIDSYYVVLLAFEAITIFVLLGDSLLKRMDALRDLKT